MQSSAVTMATSGDGPITTFQKISWWKEYLKHAASSAWYPLSGQNAHKEKEDDMVTNVHNIMARTIQQVVRTHPLEHWCQDG